jgi:hypothetical protein
LYFILINLTGDKQKIVFYGDVCGMMLKDDKIKTGRNDPCPCGSGKKYKRCCLNAKNPKPVNLEKLYHQ